MAKYSDKFDKFSEYMLGAFSDKVEKQKDIFFKLYQKYKDEKLGAYILATLPNDYVLDKISLFGLFELKNRLAPLADIDWINDYENLIRGKLLTTTDNQIIKLLNHKEPEDGWGKLGDSFKLYDEDLFLIIKNIGKERFIKIFPKTELPFSDTFKDGYVFYREFSSYDEITEELEDYLGPEFEKYSPYITGGDYISSDFYIEDYAVNSLYDELIKKDRSWENKFKNYIDKKSDSGDNLFEIIDNERDELYDAFNNSIVSGYESGIYKEIYDEFKDTINSWPFKIIETKKVSEHGYEVIEKIKFYFSVDELYDLISKDSYYVEQYFNEEDLLKIIDDSEDYDLHKFSAPYNGFDGYDDASALERLIEELSGIDGSYWVAEQSYSESKFKDDSDLIWENYISKKTS